MSLPSGRKLYYADPRITDDGHIHYREQTNAGWQDSETYGGKLTENLTQAIGRDCLEFALDNLKQAGYRVVFHIHDEVVIERHTDTPEADLEDVRRIMSGAVTNTPGLAAAQQTISELTGDGAQVNTMAQGYAAAYPLGVVGIIAAMLVIRSIFRIKVDKEVQIIEEDERNSQLKPYILTLKVTNALVEGQTLMQLHNIISANFVVSRLMNAEGKVVIPDCCNANVFM